MTIHELLNDSYQYIQGNQLTTQELLIDLKVLQYP